ncbi:hypothetical protein ACIBF5_32085 [Micromonospora sp. NPDC050417]
MPVWKVLISGAGRTGAPSGRQTVGERVVDDLLGDLPAVGRLTVAPR